MKARVGKAVVMAAALCAGLALAGCSSTGDFEFDPAYWFPTGKKKLPGERREVFPGGVPGVTQGVPPELVRGSPQQQAAQSADQAPPQAEPPKPEAKSQPKARPKKVARPAQPVDPDSAEAQPAQRPVQRQAQPAGGWPAPQGGQQQQQQQPVAPANSAWPAPPPASGTFTR